MRQSDTHRAPGKKNTFRYLLPFVVLTMVGGCGVRGTPVRGPAETLRGYADALDQNRIEDAYAMLSDEAKREMPLDAFRRMVQENPNEMRDVAEALRRPGSVPVVTATIDTPDGQALLLRYESGRWRVDVSAVDLYSQNTPRQAVTSFVRAFERGRYDVLMRFVPEAKKPGLDASKLKAAWEGSQKQEMQTLIAAVKSALPTATFEEAAGRATMPFGAVGTVQLVQENGVWKIEDFD
ncbi:MAG TPA: hypothetical protein PLJ27_04040 [Polyangiaceae bacterium]|jgi:hypothetical protein|nr:hypothetical protein [Polyangiaceae bacterium]HNZ24134.1 hypothetical protein [Polyangiaceae bacterium]HOD23799.1 hypothetical protein [Polyangiaceae bacterium]HOE48774.1 hypothetical protein [Polyangiaceae bacterium]HOH02184.1 hypothetical protein [Polyangiaceae bacterium]